MAFFISACVSCPRTLRSGRYMESQADTWLEGTIRTGLYFSTSRHLLTPVEPMMPLGEGVYVTIFVTMQINETEFNGKSIIEKRLK